LKHLIFANQPDARDGAKRRVLYPFVLIACALFAPLHSARAQSGELLHQGQWIVDAPVGGCASLPLLQVRGPGTLFEAANASALSGLQEALAVPLTKVCPGVTEVILANGRSRKLIRIKYGDAAANASSSASSKSAPVANAANPDGRTVLNPYSAPVPQAQAITTVLSSGSRPVLPISHPLSSLSSAHGQQAKCDVLFSWLELGKVSAVGRRVGAALPPQAMDIFRDDTMIAVFGRPYDALDNGARIEIAEKTFAPCDGEARRPSGRPPVNRQRIQIGGINIGDLRLGEPDRPLPPEYRQEFAQYTELIHQAFAGRPGRFEPAAVNQFLQKIREQIDWANAATGSAANAPATLDAFLRIQEDHNQVAKKAAMLRANERDVIGAYLARRQSDLAPAVIQGWLAKIATAPTGIDAANALLNSRRQMSDVFNSLSEAQRTAAEATFAGTLNSEIAPMLQIETAKLSKLQSNWQVAQELGSQEAAFLSRFGQFAACASYTTAMAQFDAARSRVYPAVLPEWRRKVAASQLQSGDIANLRDQLKVLFVSPSDRALPMFQQFEQPVRDRQAQLDAHIAEDEHRRLVEAERSAAAEARKEEKTNDGANHNSPTHSEHASATESISAGALKVGSGPDAETLNAIYEGNFEKINIDRSSTDFEAIGGGYIEGFSEKCSTDLPANRVEIMRSHCDEWWVTRNGYGMELSRTCTSSHPEGTGVFTDPELYAALHSTPVQSVGSAFRSIFDILTTKGNPFTAPIDMAVNLIQLKNDAHNMVTENACTSPAIKRFQKNLQLFALGKEGIRRDGTVKLGVALLAPTSGTKYRDSDYARMLDDMVSEQGKNWAVNRYIPGSIGSVKVDSRDSTGRPSKVSADYAFNGFSARQVGTVSLVFEEGRPSCLYFSDQPSSCRTPTHRLTTAYVQGEYR
jgi:hypothetical protein